MAIVPEPAEYIVAARCPPDIPTGTYGLWNISRCPEHLLLGLQNEFDAPTTILRRSTWGTLHHEQDPVVMEDSGRELRRHLPIWLAAHGRVLVTGLGLGCVIRGLLHNPRVEHIDCVEISETIIGLIGPEFIDEPRVQIYQGDALDFHWPASARWDFAWHDLWCEEEKDCIYSMRAAMHVADRVGRQGIWQFPRPHKRLIRNGGKEWIG